MKSYFLRTLMLLFFLPSLMGCFATISELKKERRMREALEEQFRTFKKSARKEARSKEEAREARTKKLESRFRAELAKLGAESARGKALVDKLEKQVKKGQGGVEEMFTTLQTLQSNFQRSLQQIGELQTSIKAMLQRRPEEAKRYQELQKRYEELLKNQHALSEQAIPAKFFARARSLYKAKKYNDALKTFRSFAQRFGKHPLADNALLYVGDILSKLNRTSGAIIAYDDILKNYPHGSSVPVALFRLGQLHYAKGMCKQGRSYFKKLTRYRRHAPALAREAQNLYNRWRRVCKKKRRR